ncbi:hypothetical protein QBC39DRAFT_256193, partial [Podospora conica]
GFSKEAARKIIRLYNADVRDTDKEIIFNNLAKDTDYRIIFVIVRLKIRIDISDII